ncbi:MAG: 30S ribosomal protein S18 [Christensenellales bacterium]|jgi:small subunit ribosomal protein S18
MDKKVLSGNRKRVPRKKICVYCVNKTKEINYIDLVKDYEKNMDRSYDKTGEKRFRCITEKGKIVPRRMSGVCGNHQAMLSKAIKRARFMALLPYKAE